MHPKDKYYVYKDGKCINHRPPIKVILNPILRTIQFWSNSPWVIASMTNCDSDGTAHFINYIFTKVTYVKK